MRVRSLQTSFSIFVAQFHAGGLPPIAVSVEEEKTPHTIIAKGLCQPSWCGTPERVQARGLRALQVHSREDGLDSQIRRHAMAGRWLCWSGVGCRLPSLCRIDACRLRRVEWLRAVQQVAFRQVRDTHYRAASVLQAAYTLMFFLFFATSKNTNHSVH